MEINSYALLPRNPSLLFISSFLHSGLYQKETGVGKGKTFFNTAFSVMCLKISVTMAKITDVHLGGAFFKKHYIYDQGVTMVFTLKQKQK